MKSNEIIGVAVLILSMDFWSRGSINEPSTLITGGILALIGIILMSNKIILTVKEKEQ